MAATLAARRRPEKTIASRALKRAHGDPPSRRILRLLEELGDPYVIKFDRRDATTNLAPPDLEAVHALGKSPVISDGTTIDRLLAQPAFKTALEKGGELQSGLNR